MLYSWESLVITKQSWKIKGMIHLLPNFKKPHHILTLAMDFVYSSVQIVTEENTTGQCEKVDSSSAHLALTLR